jgi:hypothetical protein
VAASPVRCGEGRLVAGMGRRRLRALRRRLRASERAVLRGGGPARGRMCSTSRPSAATPRSPPTAASEPSLVWATPLRYWTVPASASAARYNRSRRRPGWADGAQGGGAAPRGGGPEQPADGRDLQLQRADDRAASGESLPPNQRATRPRPAPLPAITASPRAAYGLRATLPAARNGYSCRCAAAGCRHIVVVAERLMQTTRHSCPLPGGRSAVSTHASGSAAMQKGGNVPSECTGMVWPSAMAATPISGAPGG